MANYLLIESHDPFTSGQAEQDYRLAADLAKRGNDVTLFLVQNGVLPARPSVHAAALTALSEQKVSVLADRFSLQERGIDASQLAAGVSAAELDVCVDKLAAGDKTIWL